MIFRKLSYCTETQLFWSILLQLPLACQPALRERLWVLLLWLLLRVISTFYTLGLHLPSNAGPQTGPSVQAEAVPVWRRTVKLFVAPSSVLHGYICSFKCCDISHLYSSVNCCSGSGLDDELWKQSLIIQLYFFQYGCNVVSVSRAC